MTTAPIAATGGHEGIVTPEAVLLELPVAGLGSRALAFLVDLAVRAVLVWAVFITIAASGTVIGETTAVIISIATAFAALLVYPAAAETIWNGRTPGKMALGLRVVTVEGGPIRFRHAAIRAALGIVDFLLGAGALAILSALATRQSQRLGDLAAGTIVIRERAPGGRSDPVAFHPPPGWEAYTAALDVSALRADAAVLVRSFLLRAHDLEPDARTERAVALAGRVASAIGVPLPPGAHPEAFLVAVAAAHQARHARGDGPVPLPTTAGTVPPPVRHVPPPVIEDDQPPAAWGT